MSMTTLRLDRLTLANFKGVADLTLDFDGKSASIYGDNATGKSTGYDAWLWLLTGKDSLGRVAGLGDERTIMATDAQFKALYAATETVTLPDYLKKVKAQRSKLNEERRDIPARLDELKQSAQELADITFDALRQSAAELEQEKARLDARLAEIESFLQEQKEQVAGINAFLQIVRKYSEITELNATLLHEFVAKIRVFQATKDTAGHRVQHVKIYFNFIGEIYVPEEFIDDDEETEQEYAFEDEETA